MTATLDPAARHRVLTEQLVSLQTEQVEALAYLKPQPGGDDADRATNVEANVRLATIEKRIETIEQELLASARVKSATKADVAELGDVVTVDLGDGPEVFLLGNVEQRGDEFDVITPGSPFGRVLLGAVAGSDVEFKASGRIVKARLLHVTA